MVVVPGPIPEAMLLARCLQEHQAADVLDPQLVTSEAFAAALRAILANDPPRKAITGRA
jgi:hypothetical protein